MVHVTKVTKDIHIPIDAVWSLVSAWGSEKLWFPNIQRTSKEGFGIGSIRTLTFKPGEFIVSERLEIADPATHTIEYALIRNPNDAKAKKPRGIIQLEDLKGGGTRFSWSVTVEWLDPNFKAEFIAFLDGMFNDAIDSVAELLKEE